MDRIDVMLEEFFAPEAPRDLASRLLGGLRAKRVELEAWPTGSGSRRPSVV